MRAVGAVVASAVVAAAGAPMNRACSQPKGCVICAPGELCIAPATPAGAAAYRDCLRVTLNQVGWINGSCAGCRCVMPTGRQRQTLRTGFLNRSKLYYHLHISKTGGTTFEQLLRKQIGPTSGLRMCDEALKTSFKLPFKHASAGLFALPSELDAASCSLVSAEGRRAHMPQQFSRQPELLTWLRNPIARTWSQWNHDKRYNIEVGAVPKYASRSSGNSTHDQMLLSQVPKDLSELYTNNKLQAQLHERYGNWQFYRLCKGAYPSPAFVTHASFIEAEKALQSYAFIGISEHHRTAMCLFYFQFSLYNDFATCQTRAIHVYNAACYENGTTNKDCVHGQAFANKFGVKSPSALSRDQLRTIPKGLISKIRQKTWLDHRLYKAALQIFWSRVRVMKELTGRHFQIPSDH